MHIIAGTHKNQKIFIPKGFETRPTSGRLRESLFNICQSYIQDAHFLDLFAGSGAVGLEALSRGAASATFVENDREAIRCIKKNVENMHFEDRAQVLSGDVFALLDRLHKLGKSFDIIYADPPYGLGHGERVLHKIETSELLVPSGDLFIEDEQGGENERIREFEHLQIVSERRMGRAVLTQYRRA